MPPRRRSRSPLSSLPAVYNGCAESDVRCAAPAVEVVARQAAVAIGVVHFVALPVAVWDNDLWAVACGATESAVDPAGPVWMWVVARPFVARAGVLATAGTAMALARRQPLPTRLPIDWRRRSGNSSSYDELAHC